MIKRALKTLQILATHINMNHNAEKWGEVKSWKYFHGGTSTISPLEQTTQRVLDIPRQVKVVLSNGYRNVLHTVC